MTWFVRRARDALRPFEQEEQSPSVKPQADNTSTKTQQDGSRSSFETPKQRRATVPVAEKPVFPLIPGRSLPVSAISVVSDTGQRSTPTIARSAVETVKSSVAPLTTPPQSGVGRLHGHFSSSATSTVQQEPIVTGYQRTIDHNRDSDQPPLRGQVRRRHSGEVDCSVRQPGRAATSRRPGKQPLPTM
jgi:hypothetical protein